MILKAGDYRHYVEKFNGQDPFEGNCEIANKDAWAYLSAHMPLFDCPDRELMLTYYFRCWSYRKHIRSTPYGRIVTEFLPEVSWADRYNAILMAANFHLDEARWLRDETLASEYVNFWYNCDVNLQDYSNALPVSVLEV